MRHKSQLTHTLTSSLCSCGWEWRSCVLIKLEGDVVFGKTILVFVFPKSLLSFWFTTPCFELSPRLPHNEVSRQCGTRSVCVRVVLWFAPRFLMIISWIYSNIFKTSSQTGFLFLVLCGHNLSNMIAKNENCLNVFCSVWRAGFLKVATVLQL